jgi:hypothetical protein
MWNPFRTLRESDGKRLRDLEQRVDDIANDATLALESFRRLDARLRQRAKRALDLEPADAAPASSEQPAESGGSPNEPHDEIRRRLRDRHLRRVNA